MGGSRDSHAENTNWEASYWEIFNAANDAIFVHDLHTGQILSVNRKACDMYGYTDEELRRCTIEDLSSGEPPYTQLEAVKWVNRAAHGEAVLFEWQAKARDGRLFCVEVNLKRATLSGRDCVLAVVRDTSERKQLEEELLQARKMQAVGQLAGGIAHDFNNLLNVIDGYSELSLSSMSASDPARKYVEKIHSCSQTAASLTKQLLAFSRREKLEAVVLDASTVVREFGAMLPRLLAENIEVVISAPDALFVKASPGQIEQVIMNLAVNARDAMPKGGTLKLEAKSTHVEEIRGARNEHVQAGPYVCFAITDTGIGMDPQTVARAFEPYFSTKQRGKGTGLGLSVVYGIVHGNGGHVLVDSERGRGTRVEIYWPHAKTELRSVEANGFDDRLPRGSETIMLVEDFEGLREMTRVFLELQGYTVVEAANGDEALRILNEHDREIDLLLTDVVMPGMSGPELAARIRAIKPNVRVLYASGYTGNLLAGSGLSDSDAILIEKPFSFPSLAAKCREVLQRNQDNRQR